MYATGVRRASSLNAPSLRGVGHTTEVCRWSHACIAIQVNIGDYALFCRESLGGEWLSVSALPKQTLYVRRPMGCVVRYGAAWLPFIPACSEVV